jgi:hypothetical protein
MRLNFSVVASAKVLISSVFASPGTPRTRQWPPAKQAGQHFATNLLLPDDDAPDFGIESRRERRGVVKRWRLGRVLARGAVER